MRRASGLTIAITLGSLVMASVVRASPTDDDQVRATALFKDAKSLLTDGKVPEACRKLEESRRLDPLPGTILNLAVCHEREGRLASAATEFAEARVLAERDQRPERISLADEHLAAIASRLSYLVVVVERATNVPDLRITQDMLPLPATQWGSRVAIDPGEHVIEATAPRRKTLRRVVTVGADGDVQTVTLPPLDEEVAPRWTPPPPPAAPIARGAEPSRLSGRRTVALAFAGLGVVAVGAGSWLGLRAIAKHGDPDAICRITPCSSTSVALNDDAKLAADVSTAGFVVGVVALAAAALLWFGDQPAR